MPGLSHRAARVDDRERDGSNQARERRVSRLRAESGTLLDGDKDEYGTGDHRHP